MLQGQVLDYTLLGTGPPHHCSNKLDGAGQYIGLKSASTSRAPTSIGTKAITILNKDQ